MADIIEKIKAAIKKGRYQKRVTTSETNGVKVTCPALFLWACDILGEGNDEFTQSEMVAIVRCGDQILKGFTSSVSNEIADTDEDGYPLSYADTVTLHGDPASEEKIEAMFAALPEQIPAYTK